MSDDGKIHGASIAEQLIAGAVLLAVGATAAHLYDVHHTKRRKKGRRAP